MSEDYAVKYQTARDRILSELSTDLDWKSWRLLRRVGGVRYGARLRELKRLGYKIDDNSDSSGDGYIYRLLSRQPGSPAGKLVKVYLDEADAELLACGFVVPAVRLATDKALRIFRANKHKL